MKIVKKLITSLIVIVLLVAMGVVAYATLTEKDLDQIYKIYEQYKAAVAAGDYERAYELVADWIESAATATLEDLKTPYPRGIYKYAIYSELIEGTYTNTQCVRTRSKYTPKTRIFC